ncbi:hypothetical protein P691DRAFT_769845 [Macrolepiota fuliginosa MF-IS2]|uniref:Uncharacterized protein n=1 Tax=Macrolepiota fuliginosa MF-IS2 TaxID=1400762 RepID=A0A9P6BVE0_9AGAR|nr:hypothetical protein P691DRAFT_769845 [Macrolepiota fuliginosa MF-IS2]
MEKHSHGRPPLYAIQDHSQQDNPPPPAAPIEMDNDNKDDSEIEELSLVEELTNTIATFGQWFKSNNIVDNVHPGLVENIRQIAMMFSLIPAPHCYPIPLPCSQLHQADAPSYNHLHIDNIPAPPPCTQPHHDDKDIPMEPIAPTHAFSKAALQTPAPSLEVSTPPPSLAAAATLPAAAASSSPASPQGHASYTGTVAKNLNPAAPPFVCGPPHAPAVQPPTQAQQPVSSKQALEAAILHDERPLS